MTVGHRITGLLLGVLIALALPRPGAAAPVPTLEGTWLLEAPGVGPATALLTCSRDGTAVIVVPDGVLRLPGGSWPVASTGIGTWRMRRFPAGEMALVFLSTDPDAAASALRLELHITLAETGQRWTGEPWIELLDGAGRSVATRTELGSLGATRLLYGRP